MHERGYLVSFQKCQIYAKLADSSDRPPCLTYNNLLYQQQTLRIDLLA